MERAAVETWVAGYEDAWRRPGTDALAELFAPDVTYRASPWAAPIVGLEELGRFWEAERDGPDEVFEMHHQIVAVDGDTAVVRLDVDYPAGEGGRWRDLWVIALGTDGRCIAFEEALYRLRRVALLAGPARRPLARPPGPGRHLGPPRRLRRRAVRG